MTYEHKIRFFNWLNLIVPILLIPIGFYEISWFLVSVAFYYFIIIIGVDIGLHRLFCHNSFKTSRFWEYILTLLTIPATTGSPLVWSAIHRCHHSHSDTDKDPHTPKKYNVFQLIVGLWDAKGLPLKMALPRNFDYTFQKFIHNHYFNLILVYCLALYLVLGFKGIVYFYILPSLMVHLHQSFINIFSHSGGYNDDSKDYSNNIKWIAPIYPILGYHHNHHLSPRDYRVGKYDFTGILIEKIFMK